MTAWADSAALVLSCCGVAALVLGSSLQRWHAGLNMALALWQAAGLIRLSGLRSWQNLAAAAVIVLVRHAVSRALRAQRQL